MIFEEFKNDFYEELANIGIFSNRILDNELILKIYLALKVYEKLKNKEEK